MRSDEMASPPSVSAGQLVGQLEEQVQFARLNAAARYPTGLDGALGLTRRIHTWTALTPATNAPGLGTPEG
jgi:hypothetical protein